MKEGCALITQRMMVAFAIACGVAGVASRLANSNAARKINFACLKVAGLRNRTKYAQVNLYFSDCQASSNDDQTTSQTVRHGRPADTPTTWEAHTSNTPKCTKRRDGDPCRAPPLQFRHHRRTRYLPMRRLRLRQLIPRTASQQCCLLSPTVAIITSLLPRQ